MGEFAISKTVKFFAWLSAAIILGLNFKLVFETLGDWEQKLSGHTWIFNFIIIPLVSITGLLLGYILWCAILGQRWKKKEETNVPHGKAEDIPIISRISYQHIAICIDFSKSDIKAITQGVAHGEKTTDFYLLHVVETAGARQLGEEIQDHETNEDWVQLKQYGNKLREQGYHVHERLGFGDPKTELPRLAEKVNAQLLVIGQHGHQGIKDFVFGETISVVRHNAKCPVLVV